jgi:hypothetical protein
MVSPFVRSSAPSAQQFLEAEGKSGKNLDHGQYMDFAERYGDFIAEFERRGGDLMMVETWPNNRVERRF